MKRIPARYHKFVAFGVYLVIFLLAFSLTFLIYANVRNVAPYLPNNLSFATPAPTPKEKTQYSVLLIGHGGAGHDGGGLADTLMLLTADKKTKKATTISIPRDSFIMGQKINNTYAVGGGALTKQAVQTVTGLDVDYFISIDFSGFEKAIDTLEGINVNVPVTFDDYFYPIKGLENEGCGKSPEELTAIHATMSGYLLEQQFTCRYEHLHFDKGVVHMDGKTALKFVRSRHSVQHGGDFARSQRQEAVLTAVKDKALSLKALDNIPTFFNQFTKIINTDLDTNVLEILYKLLGPLEGYTQKKINLTTENVFNETTSAQGAYILIPKAGNENWGPIHDFINNELVK